MYPIAIAFFKRKVTEADDYSEDDDARGKSGNERNMRELAEYRAGKGLAKKMKKNGGKPLAHYRQYGRVFTMMDHGGVSLFGEGAMT